MIASSVAISRSVAITRHAVDGTGGSHIEPGGIDRAREALLDLAAGGRGR